MPEWASDARAVVRRRSPLNLAAMPTTAGGQRWYAAGNQVGDAVLLYGMVTGGVWSGLAGVRS